MVDYTTKDTSTGSLGLWIAAGVVVLVILYALFAGGGGAVDPADPAALGTAPDAGAAAVPADDTTQPQPAPLPGE